MYHGKRPACARIALLTKEPLHALCHDFTTILLEDCCAAHTKEILNSTIENYRNFALYPLFRIMKAEQFINEAATQAKLTC